MVILFSLLFRYALFLLVVLHFSNLNYFLEVSCALGFLADACGVGGLSVLRMDDEAPGGGCGPYDVAGSEAPENLGQLGLEVKAVEW